MRFLSAALLLCSACSLIDAAGDGTDSLAHTKRNIPGTSAAPKAVVIADLDTVAGGDVAVLDDQSSLIVCFQVADGSGREFACSPSGLAGYTALAAVNLDGVGPAELLAASSSTGTLDVFAHSGGQTFMRTKMIPLGGATPTRIATGTLNLAGADTFVVALSTTGMQVLVFSELLGATPGTHHQQAMLPPPGAEGRAIAIGDVDQAVAGGELVIADGGDLVEYSYSAAASMVVRGKVLGAGPGSGVRSIALGDFVDGDARADVAFYHPNMQNSDIGIFQGTPSGLEDRGKRIGRGSSGKELMSGDLDADGDDDLVLLTEGLRLMFFVQTAAGVYEERERSLERTPSGIAVGTINLDGSADIAIVPGVGGGVDLLLSD